MYRLASHVHACRTEDQVVLLDLRADKYLALSNSQAAELGTLIVGWPIRNPAVSPEASSRKADPILSEMKRRCLIATEAHDGKDARPVEMPSVECGLVPDGPETGVRIHLGHVRRFAVACIRAACALRWRPLSAIVQSVQQRKASQPGIVASVALPAAARLVLIHERLRPFFYTARGACLYDSLVLIEFLALHAMFPTWVIGVRTGPFGAHSWVQEDHVVFNDSPELVRKFVPILAI